MPDIQEIGVHPLAGDGDFESAECVDLLQQADVVVTNPPWSLFKEYLAQLIDYEKKFVILGNKNAVTYKETFPLIKEGKVWIGHTPMGAEVTFDITEAFGAQLVASGKERSYTIVDGVVKARAQACWYTNLDFTNRHQDLLLYKKYNPTEYPKYDNFDAIDVERIDEIPKDYAGIMGVPMSFLAKHNPDQFEIIANGDDRDEMEALGVTRLGPEYIGNVGRTKLGIASTKKAAFKRVLIRNRRL